ncbi:MAG: hypothetical protein RR754_08680, partial [Oscillospiraceae bacterium]
MQGLQTQCLCGLTRVLNGKFKTLVFHRCTLLFEKKAGYFCFLAERLPRQLNKQAPLRGDFEAAVFFVTKNTAAFFIALNQNERTDPMKNE